MHRVTSEIQDDKENHAHRERDRETATFYVLNFAKINPIEKLQFREHTTVEQTEESRLKSY